MERRSDSMSLTSVPKSDMETPTEGENTPLRAADHKRANFWNLVAYWILGLCNNFGYVVMLSAAHDILSTNFNSEIKGGGHEDTLVFDNTSNDNTSRVCNPTSTGAILLADILPALAIKFSAPFFPFVVHLRMLVVVLLAAVGFLLVAFSTVEWMAILGVACTSLGSGLGEVTLLSYSSKFSKNVISTWSSGTGAAGILGASSYAGLTSLGLSPSNSLLIMLIVPAIMAATFWLMLCLPGTRRSLWKSVASYWSTSPITAEQNSTPGTSTKIDDSIIISPKPLTMREKLKAVPPLLRFMIPLGLVYLFEYFINQGLFELVYFPNIWLDNHEQYRWLQVDYQIGVFLSRSSVNLITIRKIWILAVLQFLNVVFFLFEAVYLFVPSIWIVFFGVLWEGLLGGAAYVNTFYKISTEVPHERREFSMGITSLADAIGIGLAGVIALPVHKALCKLPKPN